MGQWRRTSAATSPGMPLRDGGRSWCLVIVEGVWSVFRIDDLGGPAVALLGHDLHPEQVELLRGLPKLQRLVLLLDGDEAGRQGADQAAPLLARQFLTRIIDLPEGQQPETAPAEFLRSL